MASEATAWKRMTLDEFYAWDSGDELRYELIDGVPLAMTSTSNAHGKLVATLTYHIYGAIRADASCTVGTEVGILPPTWSSTYYQADLAGGRLTPARALLLIEVGGEYLLLSSSDNRLSLIKQIDMLEEIEVIEEEREQGAFSAILSRLRQTT